METIKTGKSIFGVFAIFITIMVLCMTSCRTQTNLEKKCILKNKEYKDFVDQHGLEDDVNDFLSKESSF